MRRVVILIKRREGGSTRGGGRGDNSQITDEPYRHVNSRAKGFIISIEMYTRDLS